MEIVRQYFNNDKLAELLGIELLEYGEGRARCKMTVDDRHLNGMRKAHGGSIFTLADFAFAVACNSYGSVAVAINTTVAFMKAIDKGATLYAEAAEECKNPRLGAYLVRITDETGDIVAVFHGLAYRKKERTADYV